jgi:hypothetical protein
MQCNKLNRTDQIRCMALQVSAPFGNPQSCDNNIKLPLHLLQISISYRIYFKIKKSVKQIYFYCHASENGPQRAETCKAKHLAVSVVLNLLFQKLLAV